MVTLAPGKKMLMPLVGRSLVGEGASGDSAFLQGCATRLLQRIWGKLNSKTFALLFRLTFLVLILVSREFIFWLRI